MNSDRTGRDLDLSLENWKTQGIFFRAVDEMDHQWASDSRRLGKADSKEAGKPEYKGSGEMPLARFISQVLS
jgi:hypothetical protein